MNDGAVVGVVAPEPSSVGAAVRAAGGVPRPGPAAAVVGESDYVVAVGESALLAVARASPAVPVLPVAAGRGVRSVPADAVESGVAALLDGHFEREDHPLVAVRAADRTAVHALLDVTLVSAAPAQISEYTVRTGDERVARFRADGVVFATPAGSTGYARAADGPVVPPGTDALVVAPVAPFSTDIDHWVLPRAPVSVSVEREEAGVNLVADDRIVGTVDPAETVGLAPADTVTVAVVDASGSPFVRE